MNYALILAGGVGQRMRSTGLPKQFLEIYNKPVIIYTLEKFIRTKDIDRIIVACNPEWIDYLKEMLSKFRMDDIDVIKGGKDRNGSIQNGIKFIDEKYKSDEDIIVIHDSVRPFVDTKVIEENIRMSHEKGASMTVRPSIETVIVTDKGRADFEDFKKREDTYNLTSPQAFKLDILIELYERFNNVDESSSIPLLDPAMIYANKTGDIGLVMDRNSNIKITTPEDYMMAKAIIEYEENKNIFGI